MIIDTKRLTLVACTPEFVESIPPEEYKIRDHVKEHLSNLQNDTSLLGWGVWFVVEKETNRIVGDIGFKGKPSSDQTVEIGYGIIPAAQNKGYATESMKALVEWAFHSGKVKMIIADCSQDNAPSIKVLERLGMKQTGSENKMLTWELIKLN